MIYGLSHNDEMALFFEMAGITVAVFIFKSILGNVIAAPVLFFVPEMGVLGTEKVPGNPTFSYIPGTSFSVMIITDMNFE